jgi:RsiW-degrading membrane proteinase PrsW (M82 family)
MSVATMIALYVEGIGGYYAVVLILVSDGAFRLADSISQVTDHADEILSINQQFVASLVVGCLLAPVAEEIGKSLGVRFVMSPNSSRAQCYMLGAIAGAAFGFLEAMMYGVGGISADLDNWWWIMLLRAGSTSGHVFWSGLAGLAWWHWTIGRQHRTALLLFAAAMLGHATWNAEATVLDPRIFFFDRFGERSILVTTIVLVSIESVAIIAAIPLVARRVRDVLPRSADETSLGGMQPWLL